MPSSVLIYRVLGKDSYEQDSTQASLVISSLDPFCTHEQDKNASPTRHDLSDILVLQKVLHLGYNDSNADAGKREIH